MNQEDPKPGVVIDVEPDTETPGSRQDDSSASEEVRPARKEPRTSSRSGMFALFLALLALFAISVVGYYGNEYRMRITSDLAAINARIDEAGSQQQLLRQTVGAATDALKTQRDVLGEQRAVLAEHQQAMDEARKAFERQEEQLAHENLQLQEREADLRAAVADVHRRVGRSGTQWITTETEYLMRVANHRLILARDTAAAKVALELADQRLRDTKDPGWAGVRELIARDIARLSTFEAPDLAGLSAQLSALVDQIPNLKITRGTIGAERTPPESAARQPDERNWQTFVDDAWAGIKDSVRIRERDQPVQAMLAPEHQFFLYENLKLHLETSRLALARGDQQMFRDSLSTAMDWISRYFSADKGAAAAISESLLHMKQTEINPDMPDISLSLRALRARMKLMEEIGSGGDRAE